MMRTLSSFVTGAAAILTVGLIGCVDVDDPFDTLTTVNPTTVGDGDGDDGTTGDGDGDSGDGDGDSGDGDGDTDCPVGTFGCPCDAGMCEDTLVCQPDDTCGLGGGDGDGDGDGDPGPGTWDPMMCAPPAQVLMVMDIEGSFCSAPCTMATQATDCPMGPPGTMPACALTMADPMVPEFCALICDPAMDACPAGSTCKDVPMQMGVGLCTFP